jgi:hypothetical protein
LSLTKFYFLTYTGNLDLDPHSFSKLDPNPHSPKKLVPDPHKFKKDPKHYRYRYQIEACIQRIYGGIGTGTLFIHFMQLYLVSESTSTGTGIGTVTSNSFQKY